MLLLLIKLEIMIIRLFFSPCICRSNPKEMSVSHTKFRPNVSMFIVFEDRKGETLVWNLTFVFYCIKVREDFLPMHKIDSKQIEWEQFL